jgi:hypothetical protein
VYLSSGTEANIVEANTNCTYSFDLKVMEHIVFVNKIGGQIIHTVKYADNLVLLAKEEKVLQDMIDELIEIGRCYGMERNVEKTK